MELKKAVKNAIQFISLVQESCDRHRKGIEHLWLQEYNSYVSDWKQRQIDIKKQLEKKSLERNKVKSEDLQVLQELALADSLLRKARNIRKKNEKTINGIIDYMSIPNSSNVSSVPLTKPLAQVPDKMKFKKRIPQSKSDYIIARNKTTSVPRSKSACGTLVPKEEINSSNSKKCSSLSAKKQAINHLKSSDKTLENMAVISNKDLDMLKKLHVSLSTCCESPNHNSSHSDSSDSSPQHQISSQPSSREFLNLMKGKLNAVSSHFKLKLWYPFMSSKSETFFSSVKCNSFPSIKRTCSILLTIQETMMWIDLLYIMESEIYPNIVFDLRDTNKLRICSYLQSIFNPKGQRIPMLDPNG